MSCCKVIIPLSISISKYFYKYNTNRYSVDISESHNIKSIISENSIKITYIVFRE